MYKRDKCNWRKCVHLICIYQCLLVVICFIILEMKFTEKDGSLIFIVRIVPRASVSEIVGEHDGALKIKIASLPVDGAANAELIKVLAKQFGVSKSAVEILSGQTAKIKQIRIFGANSEKLSALFNF